MIEQSHARKNKDGAQRQSSGDSVIENAMLRARWHAKRLKNYEKEKYVIDAEGLLDQVAAKKLDRSLAAARMKDPQIEKQGEGDPRGGFNQGSSRTYCAFAAVKQQINHDGGGRHSEQAEPEQGSGFVHECARAVVPQSEARGAVSKFTLEWRGLERVLRNKYSLSMARKREADGAEDHLREDYLREDHLRRVRRICMSMPDATEKLSHGEPTFFANNGVFTMFAGNHHHDGHIAVWIPAAPGLQAALIKTSPGIYFRPPYVGVAGWVGIELDEIGDEDLAAHILEAWQLVASKAKRSKAKASKVKASRRTTRRK
jgi:hypothetical protein